MLSSLSQRLLLVATVLATTPWVLAASLPIVDLKTSVHQAILNETGSYYSFNNIPYAEPPVGSLRFKKPTPIVTVNRTVNDGKSPRACPQGSAGWFAYSIPLVLQTIADSPYAGTPSDISNPTPDISEDCLQLDVVVPTSIYNARNTNKAGAPVLVWIHGGAYVSGYKNAYSPAGLIAESTRSGRSGIVFVEINYRL
ncbi:alpha/beta-hydrolase [Ilyonectria robusta]